MAKKPKPSRKIRTQFKKNHQERRRQSDLTRQFHDGSLDDQNILSHERVSGKGELTRYRTLIGELAQSDRDGLPVDLQLNDPSLRTGRVLRVHGLESIVLADDGQLVRCAVRQVLKSISTDARHVVVAGDFVYFRPEGEQQGVVVWVQPRRGVLSRTSKGKRHILVSNIQQILIVASAAEPGLKPHLIDRFLVTAEHAGLEAVIVINKVDLIDPTVLQPIVGVFSQLGYRVLLTSATQGWSIDRLRSIVAGRHSVVTGQSGVGKSSLLNMLEDGLALRVQAVSQENMKGKHTTTISELIPLASGGYLVDTPGIRQLELWDVEPAEVAGLFRDIRPYVNHCRFPDCQHLHEVGCAVLEAVADGRIDPRRYDSYVHLVQQD
ncbi:MAG: ribosome small subunit-dependent GTPase A [Pirellulaceae bacterium]|nr:ribosome small subunit-dependent GTPase A [Pirellulaceae bacterium]